MFAFRCIVGRVEVYERSARYDYLRRTVCAVSVVAVKYEFVCLVCVGIFLLYRIETAFYVSRSFQNVNGVNVTDKRTVFDYEFRTVP